MRGGGAGCGLWVVGCGCGWGEVGLRVDGTHAQHSTALLPGVGGL